MMLENFEVNFSQTPTSNLYLNQINENFYLPLLSTQLINFSHAYASEKLLPVTRL